MVAVDIATDGVPKMSVILQLVSNELPKMDVVCYNRDYASILARGGVNCS